MHKQIMSIYDDGTDYDPGGVKLLIDVALFMGMLFILACALLAYAAEVTL